MTSITKSEFFSNFTVRSKVGEGGYGSVFKVMKSNNEVYALKTIVCHSLDQLSASLQEIMMAFKVNNKAIIQVIHYLMDKKVFEYQNGQICEIYILGIVMEFAEMSLYDDMNQRRVLKRFYNKSTVYELLFTLVNVLAEFQAIHIAHRDLKPENVLLMKSGFKLTDFGLAKHSPNTSRSNTYAGSPYYVSPKLRDAVEKDQFDHLDHDIYKSDVFSLGLNILEAASLCDVKYLNSMKFAYRINEILQRLGKGYDPWFINILKKMLDFNEDIRPDFLSLKEIIAFEIKESNHSNPFLEARFDNNYIQDVYSYIKESEEKFGGEAKNQCKERVKDMYENFLVKKTNEKSGLPINLSNIHKKTDIFDEIATKTEKKKDNLKENLSVTKKICSPQNLKPILLQEHKIIGCKDKDQHTTSQILTTLQVKLESNPHNLLITAGEDCIDFFYITQICYKLMQNIQKFRYNGIRFNAICEFAIISVNFNVRCLVLGTSCAHLYFFKLLSTGNIEKLNIFAGFHQKSITSICQLDNDVILTGSSDFCLRIIHLALDDKGETIKPSLLRVLGGHCGGITCLQYLNHVKLAVSASSDQTIITWQTETGKRVKTVKWNCDWISTMKVCDTKGDLKAFCGSGNNGIAVFNLSTGDRDVKFDYLNQFFNGWISFIEYYEEWDLLMVCEGKGKIIIIDANHRKKVLSFEENESDICSAFLMKNSKNSRKEGFLLIVMNFDGKIKYLEVPHTQLDDD